MAKKNHQKSKFDVGETGKHSESAKKNQNSSIPVENNSDKPKEKKKPPEQEKRFYERGAWPAINFFGVILLLLVDGIVGGIFLYEKWRGSIFNFQFESTEYNMLGAPWAPTHTYFIVRGDVYNEGKSPLRIREFGLDLFFKGKWVDLDIVNMPDSVILQPTIDDFTQKVVYRNKMQWLEDIAQVDPDEAQNGYIYGIIDSTKVHPYYIQFADTLKFRIHCLTTNMELETIYFNSIKEPRRFHRPIE